MKAQLSPYELWMVASNLQTILDGMPESIVLATLRANGYLRVANALEQKLRSLPVQASISPSS